MNKEIASLIIALFVSIFLGLFLYFLFHIMGKTQISTNGVTLMFTIYFFIDAFKKAEETLGDE